MLLGRSSDGVLGNFTMLCHSSSREHAIWKSSSSFGKRESTGEEEQKHNEVTLRYP